MCAPSTRPWSETVRSSYTRRYPGSVDFWRSAPGRARLGERQAALLHTLNSGGALDALNSLQYALAREQAHLESLRHRFQAAQALEASRREIEAKRLELEQEMVTDLEDRDTITFEASSLFNTYARRLYGDGKTPI